MKRLSFLFFLMTVLGFSTSARAQTFTINSQSDWDLFASNPGNYTTVYLNTGNVTVSSYKMVGTESTPFTGTFDGQGHALTVNLPSISAKEMPLSCTSKELPSKTLS